jgi:hypothetical protein
VTGTRPTAADGTTAGTDTPGRTATLGRVRRWTGQVVGPDGQLRRDRKRYLAAVPRCGGG